MSEIFTHDCAPETPRSPYKRPTSAVPQATENLLHFDGTSYRVPFKPSRRPSTSSLLSSGSGSPTNSPRPQSALGRSNSNSSSTLVLGVATVSTANSSGMRDVMHHDAAPVHGTASSPRKIGISPGGPTSIILG
jgi:hypothetical protein